MKNLKPVHVPANYRGLHCEVPGAIVNIYTNLSDADGRKVTTVEIICDQYAGEPPWTIDGHRSLTARVVQGFTCSECGAPITDTQAKLSRMRADGAQPGCKDCCTKALTARWRATHE